ncbi:MAG: outer membrane beta-barrel protein [Rhodospirillaceae bacterium]|nr:outer membrane beta-barrel protein [Rhodospirillaceae bacterium]
MLIVAACIALPVSSSAQAPTPAETPGVSLSDDGTRVIYGPEFFAEFGAVTAIDILRRIPGIQDLLDFDNGGFVPGGSFDQVEKRGFGSEGQQILINGERVSGKTNDTGAALQRIQARQVERIEVIRGAVAGLDVRSEGLVVNVVLKDSSGSGSWEANGTYYTGGRVRWGGRANYAGAVGALSYNIGVEEAPHFLLRERTENYFTPGGANFQRNFENNEVITDERILTASANYAFANGDRLGLNGRYADRDDVEENPTFQFAVAGQNLSFLRLDSRERDTAEKTFEIGGDYTRDFTGGGQFKGLFVYTHGTLDRVSPFRLTPAGQPEIFTRLQNEDRTNSEKIVRGSYQWPWTETLSAELGSEVAINTLSKDVQMSVDQAGVLRPVRLFNALSRIRETRLEPFSSLAWQATDTVFVDARLEAEYSKLNQTGPDATNRRTLFYVRPGLDVRYDVAPLNQLRASVQRAIGQLDFADFVATFETDDSRLGTVNAGNPDLVPEKTWEYSLTYERRLASDGGVITVKAFYNDVTDLIGSIAVGPLRDVSAVGNVGKGRQYGVESKASLRLAALGLPGVVVNATALVRKSNFTDPFTGARMDFEDYPSYAYSFGFRHDTSWRDFSYGATFDDEGHRFDVEINTVHELNRRFDGTVFVEMRAFGGVKAKLEVRRILRGGAERDRSTFTGNRGFSPLLRRENRVAIFDRAIAFTLRGTF